MNIITVGKALKFYDLKPEGRVRVWFLVLMGLFAASFILPFVDPDFSELLEQLLLFASGEGTLPRLNGGQWNFLLMQAGVRLLAVFASIDYLKLYLQGNETIRPRAGTWFRLVLFQILTTIIYLASAPFMLIPYFFFISFFLFVQPELLKYGGSISKSMQQSYLLGQGVRLLILSSVLLITAVFLIVETWLLPIAKGGLYGTAMIGGFLFAWEVLSKAKLTGILYTSLLQRARIDRPLTPK